MVLLKKLKCENPPKIKFKRTVLKKNKFSFKKNTTFVSVNDIFILNC